VLQTLEGVHQLRDGDYICTGPKGEKWNVERSIFESTYEPAMARRATAPQPQPVEAAGSAVQAEDLQWHKEALAAARGKLDSVWKGIEEAVEKYSGAPCKGEPFDRLDELLVRLSATDPAEPVGAEPFMWVNPEQIQRARLTEYAESVEAAGTSVKFGHFTMPLYAEPVVPAVGGALVAKAEQSLIDALKDIRDEALRGNYDNIYSMAVDALAAPTESAAAPADQNALRMAFLHSTNKDADGYEYGVAKVKFSPSGQIESFLWALSDHSDIDAAIRATPQPTTQAEGKCE
jgi:hypothetical protein